MTNGLGAAFGGLVLLAVLAGLALALSISLGGLLAYRKGTGTIPRGFSYLSLLLLAGVILVGGFAVLALYDEAPLLAGAFVALVFLPLATTGIYLDRTTVLRRVDLLSTIALAWSGPFLVGLAASVGGLNLLTTVLDVAPAEARNTGLPWVATAIGAVVVVLGGRWVGKRVSHSIYSAKGR